MLEELKEIINAFSLWNDHKLIFKKFLLIVSQTKAADNFFQFLEHPDKSPFFDFVLSN